MSWEERIEQAWKADVSDEERIALIDALADERPASDALALFERAGARDSAGLEAQAEPLYRAALEAGLDEEHHVQAVIQLASTLRNLGRLDESLRLLRAEYERGPTAPLHDSTAAFYALALTSAGEAAHGVSVALSALAPHLPRYTRSVAAYAAELV
jgi:tetratricopeptide (TPR) repeat protein